MKKFTLILFLILNSFLFSIGLNRDVDIIDMPLHEVLAVLSKECGRNLICSKEAKDIVIDTYFNKGEDLDYSDSGFFLKFFCDGCRPVLRITIIDNDGIIIRLELLLGTAAICQCCCQYD